MLAEGTRTQSRTYSSNQPLALHHVHNLKSDVLPTASLSLLRTGAQVRTADDARMLDQGTVLRRLLQTQTRVSDYICKLINKTVLFVVQMSKSCLDKDVEPCSSTLSRLQSSEESGLVNDAPSGTVHNLHSFLAFGKRFVVQQTFWNKRETVREIPQFLIATVYREEDVTKAHQQ